MHSDQWEEEFLIEGHQWKLHGGTLRGHFYIVIIGKTREGYENLLRSSMKFLRERNDWAVRDQLGSSAQFLRTM